jgi:hypothetical protein
MRLGLGLGKSGAGQTPQEKDERQVLAHDSLLQQPMVKNRVLKGQDFTGCGKTRSGGRPGIYPRHKARRINEGFSPGGQFFSDLHFRHRLLKAEMRGNQLENHSTLAPPDSDGCRFGRFPFPDPLLLN